MAIIESILDTDYYKLLMMQWVWKYRANVPVHYFFYCRTPGIKFTELIDVGKLREEMNNVGSLTLSLQELNYLRALKIGDKPVFEKEFLDYLHSRPGMRSQWSMYKKGYTYHLDFEGTWLETILWETPALAIVNELYHEGYRKACGISPLKAYEKGLENLAYKRFELSKLTHLNLIEFGTRRRYSREWQHLVLQILLEDNPQWLLGTSNVKLAMEHGIEPKGTMAHELPMGEIGKVYVEADGEPTDDMLRMIPSRVTDLWAKLYPYDLRIDLPDTFGSRWALAHYTEDMALNWKGMRHDSGSVYAFGEALINQYTQFGIDPLTKHLIPSDGLDAFAIRNIHQRFQNRISLAYGWGSNLTCDVISPPISIIIKLMRSYGYPTVKLSDNPAKAQSQDPRVITRFQQVFDYPVGTESISTKY